MRRGRKIAIILLVCIGCVFLYSAFDVPRPSPATRQGGVVGTLRSYLKYKHPAGEPPPADLVASGIYGEHLERCAPTTETKAGKFLVIYNPHYRTEEKDWVLIVLGRTWFGLKELEPFVFWSDIKPSAEPNALTLVSGKDGLCYYYFTP